MDGIGTCVDTIEFGTSGHRKADKTEDSLSSHPFGITTNILLSLPNQVKMRQKLQNRLKQRRKHLFVDSNTVSKERESSSS